MMRSNIQNIPEMLIYEMAEGKPIYYKGYREYLNGKKEIGELIGCSYLQSLIITKLVYFLISKLDRKYLVLTNELGLQFKDKGWRAADIAIVEKEKLKGIARTNKYLSIPPKIVIEIDTKAALEDVKDSLGYFHKKTDELLNFGVEKVIWVFSDSEKVMIATKGKDWTTHNWNKNVLVLDAVSINIQALIDEEEL